MLRADSDAGGGMVPGEPLILRADSAGAAIALRGAEWREWSIRGADLLWPGDPAVWAAIAPILFPVVGWTRQGRVRVGATHFALGLHGFAADIDFALAERGEDYATLVLEDGPQTRSAYPFPFRLEVEYRLREHAIDIALSVRNTGRGPMPYAIGLHPGFRWPFAGSDAEHRIVFEAPEHPEVPVIAPGGLFSAQKRRIPLEGTLLRVTPDLFAHEALCFLDVASRKLLYDSGAGPGLLISLENFPHVVLWARPPALFLAIEAWTGHGDPENFDGDLFEKPSMIVLPAGAQGRHAVRYEFVPDVSRLGLDLQAVAHLPKGP